MSKPGADASKLNATKAVFCTYSIALSTTDPLLAGSATVSVKLLCDAANPPAIERARAAQSSTVGLSVTAQLAQGQTYPLSFICPAGHFVKLETATAGTASAAIVAQTEAVLG